VIKQKDLIEYIKKIPPLPKSVEESLHYLQNGELAKAAERVKEDKALLQYLIDIVNKPYFGFRNRVENVNQIFGILGIENTKQILYSYLISLLTPKSWKVFNLTNKDFYNLQSKILSDWNKILEYEKKQNDANLKNSVIFILLSILTTEEIFKDHIEDINIIRQVKEIDYDELLRKFTNMSLLDIAALIVKKWRGDETIIKIIKALSNKDASDKNYGRFIKYLHLLLFFELSQPEFIKAGLNNFMEFDPNFVKEVFEDFIKITNMENYETCN